MDTEDEFSDGLAQTYKDGLPVPLETGPDDEPSPHHIPPDGLSSEDLQRFQELTWEERRISARRRQLHARIDFVKAQGSDDDTIAHLDYLLRQERELSKERKALHREIDGMRSNKDSACPMCGEPVDPNDAGVTYAVPKAEESGAVGAFLHPGCPPTTVDYVPRTLPGADLTTP